MINNILITGGCGFIASNFINNYFYKNLNCNIINIDAMYYCANVNNIKEEIRTSSRYKFIKGNICNEDLVNEILYNYKIDSIVHFAAQSHVQNSFDNALLYTKDNVLGTHTLLHCIKEYNKTNKINKFIHVSTDEVYGESLLNDGEIKKTEFSILCPTNPYAASKAGAELLAQSYYKSFNLPIIITRGNNVYGPNQYPEKVIPLFIKLLKENKKLTIQGDGSNVRGFLYVDDVCDAFEVILEKGVVGEIYNIGSDEHHEYSILELAKILVKLIKNTDNYNEWITYIEDRPFNDKRYYISNEKVKKLGWEIQVDFMDGITKLVQLNYYN